MLRHTLSNPEIRLVSTPQIPLSNHAPFSHTSDLDILADIPGFSTGMYPIPCTPTSTEPYQSKVESFSSTSRTATPATPIYPSVDPAVKEEHSPKAAITSPVSPTPKKLPIQVDFKPRTKQQRKYDKRFKGQGEQIPSDVLKE